VGYEGCSQTLGKVSICFKALLGKLGLGVLDIPRAPGTLGKHRTECFKYFRDTYSEGMILLTPASTAASISILWLGTASVATAETKASCPSSAFVSDSRFV
jgi:hypothetical protein